MNQFVLNRLSPTVLAIALMFGAGGLVAVTSLLAKTLGLPTAGNPGLSPFQVSAGRFCFALIALLLFLLINRSSRPTLTGAHWRWHLLRSICGWLGITCMFAAVATMPVSEATAISFLSPVVSMILAVFMLGERLGPRKIIAVSMALIGAMLILKPGSEALQLAGLFALLAAFFMGMEAIFIKRLSDTEPVLRVLLINNTIGACLSLGAALLVWAWPNATQWMLLVTLGSVMILAQTLFIQAMKRGDASFVIPAFYSVLVFASLYDYAIYDVIPSLMALVGAGFIVSGALVLAFRKPQ